MNRYCILSVFVIVFLHCAMDPTNPWDPAFRGDYSYESSWVGDRSTDTMVVFSPYTLRIENTGEYDFFSFSLKTVPEGCVDTSHYVYEHGDSILTVYFVKPFEGQLFIRGKRPNGIYDDRLYDVTVVNPWNIAGDSLAGLGDKLELSVNGGAWDSLFTGLSVIWSVEEENHADTLEMDSLYGVGVDSAKECVVSAAVLDSFGNTLTVPSKEIRFTGYSPIIESFSVLTAPQLGERVLFSVKIRDADDDSVHVLIFTDSDTLTRNVWVQTGATKNIETVYPVTDTGKTEFFMYVEDDGALTAGEKKLEASVSYQLPAPDFGFDTLTLPADTVVTVRFDDPFFKKGTLYNWTVATTDVDTVTDKGLLPLSFDSAGTYTLTVVGTDPFGYQGAKASVAIVVGEFIYDITKVRFPLEVKVGELNTWIVNVEKNGTTVAADQCKIQWTVKPDSSWDSFRVAHDTLYLGFSDSIPGTTIKVAAQCGGESTVAVQEKITTQWYKPYCRFGKNIYTGKIGDSIAFDIECDDTNDNGSVDTVFLRREGDTTTYTTTRTDSITLSFMTHGTFNIYAWAVDNEGLLSDTDTVILDLKADIPYFPLESTNDTIFINDTVLLEVFADPGTELTQVTKYFWDLDNDSVWDKTTTENAILFISEKPGADTILVGCESGLGKQSENFHRIQLITLKGTPRVKNVSVAHYAHFIQKDFELTIEAIDTNGFLRVVFIDTTGDFETDYAVYLDGDTNQIDTTVALPFTAPGEYSVSVSVLDDDTLMSDWVTLDSTLTVLEGKPRVDSLVPESLFVFENKTFTIFASDNTPPAAEYFISPDSVHFYSLNGSDSFDTAFTTAGAHSLYVYVIDSAGIKSDIYTHVVHVDPGIPNVGILSLSTALDSIYIHDPLAFSFYPTDENGSIHKVYISYAGTDIASDSIVDTTGGIADVSFSNTFATAGEKSVKIWVVDNHGYKNEVMSHFVVQAGTPYFSKVVIDTSVDSIFINDPRRFSFTVSDSNPDGYLTTVYASWDGDDIAEDSLFIAGQRDVVDTHFVHQFSISESGEQNLRFWVVDEDTVSSSPRDTLITIHGGMPKIESFGPDSIWPIDDTTLTIKAFDTNGVIDSAWFVLDNDTSSGWTELFTYNTNDSTMTIDTSFAVADTGMNYYWVKVRDDDGLFSAKRCSVFVKLGRPRLWIDGDTLFAKTPGNGGDVDITVNEYDTNGTIETFYWDFNSPFDTSVAAQYKTNSSIYSYNILSILVNTPFEMAVFGKDDDSLMAGDTFWLYPDGPPEKANLLGPVSVDYYQSTTPTITFVWENTDIRDGLDTKFQIMIKNGGAFYALDGMGFEDNNGSLISYDSNNDRFSFQSSSVELGTNEWFVIAQDQNGSTMESDTVSFRYFP